MARPVTQPENDDAYSRCYHECPECHNIWSHRILRNSACLLVEGMLCEPCEIDHG